MQSHFTLEKGKKDNEIHCHTGSRSASQVGEKTLLEKKNSIFKLKINRVDKCMIKEKKNLKKKEKKIDNGKKMMKKDENKINALKLEKTTSFIFQTCLRNLNSIRFNALEKTKKKLIIKFNSNDATKTTTRISALRFNKKFDLHIVQQAKLFQRKKEIKVNDIYKKKNVKIKSVNNDKSDDTIPEGITNGKKKCFKKEIDLSKNLKYSNGLIPKFFKLARDSRLTPERLQKMIMKKNMTNNEKNLLIEMLFCKKIALTGNFDEMKKIKIDINSSIKIDIIFHEAGQTSFFALSRALTDKVSKMLKKRLHFGVLELCKKSYKNLGFLIKKKKSRKYKIVNATLNMNKMIIRNAHLSSTIDEFFENFVDCFITSFIDFFAKYDQMNINLKNKNMTIFMTLLKLLRMITFSMKAINSMTQFVKMINKILNKHIFHKTKSFVDDVRIKESKINYDNQEVTSKIRKFVQEHIMGMNAMIANIERASCTIFEIKSQFCMSGLKIVEFIIDFENKHLDTQKIIKIVNGPKSKNDTQARVFIDVCVYYRIGIEFFVMIVELIYKLLKKNVKFKGEKKQIETMNKLKMTLIFASTLIIINYVFETKFIILIVNAFLLNGNAIFMQLINDKRHSIKYEFDIGNDAKRNYDAIKRECREVFKVLKKFKYGLYEMHFFLEIDVNVLMTQFNEAVSNLLEVLIMRGIAGIRLFDFDVKHVASRKHTIVDDLFRRSQIENEKAEQVKKVNINDFIDVELNSLSITSIAVNQARVLTSKYNDKMKNYVLFFITLKRFTGLKTKEFKIFKKKVLRFRVQNKHLYRKASKNVLSRKMINDNAVKQRIMKHLHDEKNHKNREETYHRIINKYGGANMHEDVKSFVRNCEICQKRDSRRLKKALHSTGNNYMGQKINLNVVHMPDCKEMNYLVVIKNDLSRGLEAKTLRKVNAEIIFKFLGKNVICKHDCFERLIIDDEFENKKQIIDLTNKYDIKKIVIFAYHSQANDMIEREHKLIIDALFKMINDELDKGVNNLHAIF